MGLLSAPEKTLVLAEKSLHTLSLYRYSYEQEKESTCESMFSKIKLLVIPIPLHLDILFPESFFKGSGLEP